MTGQEEGVYSIKGGRKARIVNVLFLNAAATVSVLRRLDSITTG